LLVVDDDRIILDSLGEFLSLEKYEVERALSFAEAMQVNQEETFWAILGKDLQGCPNLRDRQVEMINFGEAGFGTAQELLALRHRAWKYSPDIVLLAFFTGNDMADNSPVLMGHDYNPYFKFQDGQLVLMDQKTREKWEAEQRKRSWGKKFYRWRQDHFRVSQVLRQFRLVFQEWRSQSRKTAGAVAPQPGTEAGLSDTIYREPVSAVWQEAWKVTEALLLLMRDEVTARGARFFVVVLTTGTQVHPDPAVRTQSARELGVDDLFYPDRRLEKFCQRQGIPILLLAPAFQEYATAHQVFLHGFKDSLGVGHWNQQGHRLAGKLIAQWLCGQLH